MPKSEKWWCVQGPEGTLLDKTARREKGSSVEEIESETGECWAVLRRNRYRCIQISVGTVNPRIPISVTPIRRSK